jgi:hypothetical protein
MSYDLFVYLKDVNDQVIPPWKHGLRQLGFDCEFHPEFSFKDQSGFLPMKVQFLHPHLTLLRNRYFLTGYEMDVSDYHHQSATSELSMEQSVKQSFWDKVFKKNQSTPDEYPENIAGKLEVSNTLLTSYTGSSSMEMIMAWFTLGVLVSMLDGVLYDPQEGKYYDNHTIILQANKILYDLQSTPMDQWHLHEFKEWR